MSLPIRLIVGLGNPGAEYAHTRHNAGFWLLDALAGEHNESFRNEAKFFADTARARIAGENVWLLKPMTFMNRSGRAVGAVANYLKIQPEEVLVAHDELDLAPGVVKLKQGGGHAGHNGLRDIIQVLGSKDFWRLRIGIDHPGSAAKVVNYVLGRPSRGDREAMDAALSRVLVSLPEIVSGEIQRAMNRLHQT